MKTQMTRFLLGMAFAAQSFSASAEGIQLTRVEPCDQRAGLGLILQNELGETMGLRSLYLNYDQMILNTKDGEQMILRCGFAWVMSQRKARIVIQNGDETTTERNAEFNVEIPGGGTVNLKIEQQDDGFAGAELSKDGNVLRMACNALGQLRSVWMKTGANEFQPALSVFSNLARGSQIQGRGSVMVLKQGERVQSRQCMTIQEQQTYFANKLNLKDLERSLAEPSEVQTETLETEKRQQQAPARVIGVD